jgi:hypothetical protein
MVRDVSPLPPGRYWLRVLGDDNIKDFSSWVRDMAGGVRVEESEEDTQSTPRQLFVIFSVPQGRQPFLNAALFGFPNTAPPEVHSSADVDPDAPPVSFFGDIVPPFKLPEFSPGLLLLLVLALSFGGSFGKSLGSSSSRAPRARRRRGVTVRWA